MSTEIIIFMARDLIWVLLAFAVVLIGLDLWKDTNSHHNLLKRIKSANWRKVGFIALAFLLSFLVAQLFHLWPIEIYRPYQIIMTRPLVMPSLETPFPSDHAMVAFALALAVIFMTRFKRIGLVALILAIGVGLGRVFALVHSPLDVFGGIVCAIVGAAVWYYLYYRETPKNLLRDIKTLPKKLSKMWASLRGDISAFARKMK